MNIDQVYPAYLGLSISVLIFLVLIAFSQTAHNIQAIQAIEDLYISGHDFQQVFCLKKFLSDCWTASESLLLPLSFATSPNPTIRVWTSISSAVFLCIRGLLSPLTTSWMTLTGDCQKTCPYLSLCNYCVSLPFMTGWTTFCTGQTEGHCIAAT